MPKLLAYLEKLSLAAAIAQDGVSQWALYYMS